MNVNSASLVVIEDEIAVRRSIIGKIRKESLSLTIEGEFQNAEEAYLHIQNAPPEIILLDMRMPGMGGMKFLEVLNNEFPDIQVIVLSGYSEFEYLQKAIQCGAKDYLLKPVVREDLRKSLQEAIEQVRTLKNSKILEENKQLLFKNNIALMKANLLHRIIHEKEIMEADIFKRLKELGEIQENHSYLFISGKIKNSNINENTIVNSNIFEKVEKELVEILGDHLFLSNKGDIRRDDIQCVFAFKERNSNDDEGFSQLKPKLQNIVLEISEATNTVIHLSISKQYKNILDTKNKYMKSSYSSLTVGQKPSVFYFEDMNDTSRKIVGSSKVKQILKLIEENNRESIISTVEKWFKDMTEEEDLSFAQRLAIDIVIAIESNFESKIPTVNNSNVSEFTFYDSIKSYKSIEDIKYKVILTLNEISDKICKEQLGRCDDVTMKVKKLIEERYMEEITLEAISSKFHVNKSYLSELFKKEIGLTFNKYLNWVRIEKAKELLVIHDMHAAKIAALVGYNDHVYFSIVFKKFTGLPPGMFKQKYRKKHYSA